jgi:hypothetical protein
VSWRRGIRALLVGAIAFIIALIYVPQCPVRVYADNADALSFALAAVVTFFTYRLK